MSGLWRLKGARFRRADGDWVQSGAVFEPTDEELARRAGKLEYVGPKPKKKSKPKKSEADDASD